jgi:Matrixin
MRLTIAATVLIATLALAGSAVAAIPQSGYLIFKETRAGSVTEVRATNGQLVFSGKTLKHGKKHQAEECTDNAFVLAGPTWPGDAKYNVNILSAPWYLNSGKALRDVESGAEAWESPFKTDCKKPKGKNSYDVKAGSQTLRHATLVTQLESDGRNTVAWESLAGTVCDGGVACVVIEYEDDTILEADLAFEADMTRYGFQDFWTTDKTTWFDDVGGRLAISDVATHEFGHFAGLDHTTESPTLTMYPFMHDGDETLGLGDMLGLLELY